MKNNEVSIVGMGYVGITLTVVLADKGFNVVGIDKNEEAVNSLNRGKPHLFEPGVAELLQEHANRRINLRSSYPEEMPKIVVICVSTPIDTDTKKPMLNNLINASKDITNHLSKDSLVIVRSTIPVGASRNIVLPILMEKVSDVKLAFCPERTIQGQALRELQELPQIIGGLNEESVEAAVDLFKKITPTTIVVRSLEAAEMIKLICNCHTDLIYGYGNEVALMAEKFGLDPVELIKSANLHYPRPDLILPGFVGGGCLSKDPYILISSFEEFSYIPTLVKDARELNEYMPVHIAKKAREKLKSLGKKAKEVKVFVMGFAYKGVPLTDDLRGAPAQPVVEYLKNYMDRIYGHDFMVTEEEMKNLGAVPCSIEEGFKDADCVIFLNNHPSYRDLDVVELVDKMRKPALLIDCWRIFDTKVKQLKKVEGLIYGGIGYEQ